VRHALRYAWVIAIGAGCFTARLLIGRSAAESDSYGMYVLLSAVATTAAIVTAIFLPGSLRRLFWRSSDSATATPK